MAEVVIRADIEDFPLIAAHMNLVLLKAASNEGAFAKAIDFGQEHNQEYLNPDGKKVVLTFAGLRNLFNISDGLEKGAEWNYEKLDLALGKITKPKEQLSVFTFRRPGSAALASSAAENSLN